MAYKELEHYVPKGWGYEKWIVNNDKYCGKVLYFIKGKKCSWHYHKLKHETFYIQEGQLKVIYGVDNDIEKAETIILIIQTTSSIQLRDTGFFIGHGVGTMSR